MAAPRDYRKPRNQEMRDLLAHLPHPVRVLNESGTILWQNPAAEAVPEEIAWTSQPTSWQGEKANLAVTETPAPSPSPLLAELEAENERLRRHQKQTARRKKKAEDSAKQTEKAAETFEKRERKLREQLEASEKKAAELQAALNALEQSAGEESDAGPAAAGKEKGKGKKSKAKSKAKGKSKGKQTEPEDVQAEASNEVASDPKLEATVSALRDKLAEASRSQAELQEQLEEASRSQAELQEQLEEASRSQAELRAQLEESSGAKAEHETNSRTTEEGLRAELRSLQAQLDAARTDFAGKANPLAARLEAAAARYVELEAEFDAYRQEVEEQESQRQLEEQLAEKVRELEELERSFEDEQKAFLQQKHDLESRLSEQEVEFVRLRDTVSGTSQETPRDASKEVGDLREDLEEARLALAESTRRETRLSEKLESANELKEEQSKVLSLIKDELSELRQREKDLRETLRLYGDFRSELERARGEAKQYREEALGLREATEKLEAKLIESRRELAESKSSGSSGGLSLRLPNSGISSGGESLSGTVKSQLEFAQSRLRETEKQLDEARSALKKAQSDAHSAKETEKLAFQDSLTGLPNRHIVDRFLDFSHKQAKSSGKNYALFLIDVDGFRVLNDTFGRDWGDALLKAIAERLSGMRGKNHVMARHSQDRFLLLAGDLLSNSVTSFVSEAARALLDALAHPFEVKGESIKLTGSLGISVGPGRTDDFKELLPHAELALENAKSLGPGTFVVYSDGLAQKAQRDQTYLRQMEHAITREEFQNVYQPVFNLNKGMVTGVELLLRWHHRDQRVLKPEEFLDVALSSGLIFAIAEVTWPKAFKALARWRRRRPGVTLSINLSDRELLNPKLVERATEWAQKAGVETSAILFEVRDASRLRSSSSWWTILAALQRAGFGLVLDDYAAKSSLFGTLAFSGFVQAKTTIDEKNPICTPAPAAHKGVQYVAKRIQTRFDPKALKKAGFDLAQGSAVAQPLDEDAVDGILS